MAVGIVEYVVIMAGGPSRGLSEQLPSQHIPEILLLEAEYDRFSTANDEVSSYNVIILPGIPWRMYRV